MERFFAQITERRLRRESFQSVRQLRETIAAYINNHNQTAKPFVWTASAELILGKVEYVCNSLRSQDTNTGRASERLPSITVLITLLCLDAPTSYLPNCYSRGGALRLRDSGC